MNRSTVPERRAVVVNQLMNAVRDHLAVDGVTRETLAKVGEELQSLVANSADLFSTASFPAPLPEDKGGVRYFIHTDPSTGISLYLNAIGPGKSSPPHNHMTWAAIAAIEGEELNRIYNRTDDGASSEQASLELAKEFNVRKGFGIQFLPDDIHSIHIEGNDGTRHFHLYGQPLESLDDRLGFNLETGAIVRFNAKHLPPAKFAVDSTH